jgi:cytochrome P450
MEYIKVEMVLVLLAGAVTTGSASQALMRKVMGNPVVYERMMEEIDLAAREGKLSSMAQYEEVVAYCPYFIACVRESLRLNPPVSSIFPRLVPKGEFKPECWLNAKEAKEYKKYNMTFGFGPRVCLGREIVYMELFKAPLQFFRTFKPTVLDNSKYVYRGGLTWSEDEVIQIERRLSTLSCSFAGQ